LAEAEIIFNAFWGSPLKLLKENMQKYWETTGSASFLKGDGRKLPIRSLSTWSTPRSKRWRYLCQRVDGTTTDVMDACQPDSSDDRRNMSYCQQLDRHHDEAQLEICRDRRRKKFEDEAAS
jgi:hypothetical protein